MRPSRRLLGFAVLGLLLLVALEFVLFDQFGSRRVTSIYPRWNDQILYLSEAYSGYELSRTDGLAPALWHTLTNLSAQGTLHDFFAVLAFQVVGPSRSAALALNFLALALWQAALFYAIYRRSGTPALAFLFAMLPLALHGPWENIPGSAYDFRLDHLGMCGFGISAALGLLTEGLRVRRWCVAFGVAVGLTLLTRFITGTYFVLIFTALFIWAALAGDRRQRLVNVLLAAGTAAVIAVPIFWLNREWVWNYYYVGHYVGPESAIRNQNFGLQRSLEFILNALSQRHLGSFFAKLAAVIVFVLPVLRLFAGKTAANSAPASAHDTPDPFRRVVDIFVLGLVFLLSPLLVLTLHPQKSDVVLGVLVPGLILLLAGIAVAVGSEVERWRPGARRALALVAALGVFSTLGYFAQRQLRAIEQPATTANAREVNAIADYIITTGDAAKLPTIRVAVDNITDAFDAQVLRVICYERRHVWRNFDMRLPTGIAAPEDALVRQRVADSDFVFLTDDAVPPGPYPFDHKLASLRPELRAWCEAHLRRVKTLTFNGATVTLYERPDLRK
ncbi:hypothetical protein [Opitutus sp. ER46]|uniref:hypothetical protein n=1 Tax=Opitutus sp. ER46 TaxID=2161864 RepID=UPI000D314730|nr:hypothetical protein [Opitutus sp. ER46]PTX92600.1 hypothetical protein DB354_14840 [Opitutus sp. ER46]